MVKISRTLPGGGCCTPRHLEGHTLIVVEKCQVPVTAMLLSHMTLWRVPNHNQYSNRRIHAAFHLLRPSIWSMLEFLRKAASRVIVV